MIPSLAVWSLFLLSLATARPSSRTESEWQRHQANGVPGTNGIIRVRADPSKACSRGQGIEARDEDIFGRSLDLTYHNFNHSQYIIEVENDVDVDSTIEARGWSLSKRAPTPPRPDKLPALPRSDNDALAKAEQRYNHANSNKDLEIEIPNNVVRQWIVDGMVVSATAEYHPFNVEDNKRQTWKMRGLEGCTGTIIFSERGFWASHLWEHGDSVRAPGVHFTEGSGAFKMENHDERPDDRFKRIAVDIHNSITQPPISTSGYYTSLADVRASQGNPFGNPNSVHILIMTPNKSEREEDGLRYESKIQLLRDVYAEAIPGIPVDNIAVKGYTTHYDSGEVPLEHKHGFMSLEFTPYQKLTPKSKGCSKTAMVRAWVEANKRPALEFEFDHNSRQG